MLQDRYKATLFKEQIINKQLFQSQYDIFVFILQQELNQLYFLMSKMIELSKILFLFAFGLLVKADFVAFVCQTVGHMNLSCITDSSGALCQSNCCVQWQIQRYNISQGTQRGCVQTSYCSNKPQFQTYFYEACKIDGYGLSCNCCQMYYWVYERKTYLLSQCTTDRCCALNNSSVNNSQSNSSNIANSTNTTNSSSSNSSNITNTTNSSSSNSSNIANSTNVTNSNSSSSNYNTTMNKTGANYTNAKTNQAMNQSKGLSMSAIIGITIGVVAASVILSITIYCLVKTRQTLTQTVLPDSEVSSSTKLPPLKISRLRRR